MSERDLEKKLRDLDEALAEGRISEETYRELREKYMRQLETPPPPPPSPRKTWLPIALAIVVIAAVAAGGLLYLKSKKPAPAPTPTPAPTPAPTAPPRPRPSKPKPPKPTPSPSFPETPRPRRTPASAPTPAPTPRASPTPTLTPRASYGELFLLSKVKSFSYRMVTTTAQGQRTEMTQRYEVSSKLVDGRDCWALTVVTEMYGNRVTLVVYLDKRTLECVKAYIKSGQMEIGVPCAQYSSTMVFARGQPEGQPEAELTFIGYETVQVPAGTFTCEVYESRSRESVTRCWVSRDVPVPVKVIVETASEKVVIELLSYQPA